MALQINTQQPPNPIINGAAYSHQSVIFTVDGVPYEAGLVSINYSTSLNPQPLKTTTARPVAHTAGGVDESGDIELATQWGKALIAMLGHGYGGRVHTLVVQKNESGDVQTDTILARFKKLDQQSSGDAPLTMKLELLVMKVLVNGYDIAPAKGAVPSA